ncbi:MAG: DUF6249 domain-containing protein [Flavobacteriales bacterium]
MHEIIAVSIPIFVTLGAFTMIVILRRLEHLEKIKMIEKGLDISKYQRQHKPGGAIKFALISVGIGVGLLMGSLLKAYTQIDHEVCYFSMIFLFAGAGLFIANKIVEKKEKEGTQE